MTPFQRVNLALGMIVLAALAAAAARSATVLPLNDMLPSLEATAPQIR